MELNGSLIVLEPSGYSSRGVGESKKPIHWERWLASSQYVPFQLPISGAMGRGAWVGGGTSPAGARCFRAARGKRQRLQTVFDFGILALVIFLLVRAMNRLQHQEETAPAAPPEPSAEEKLLGEIRDLLRSRG